MPDVKLPQTVGELTAAPWNPRAIDAESAQGLGFSMDTFGDISGLVFNVRTGHLVCGQQRRDKLPPDSKIESVVNFEEPDGEVGTVGYGQITHGGTHWRVRFVDWEEIKEKAANLAANNAAIAGQFTEGAGIIVEEVNVTNPELAEGLRLEEINWPAIVEEPIPPGEFPGVDENLETTYCCPKCGYEWSGKPK